MDLLLQPSSYSCLIQHSLAYKQLYFLFFFLWFFHLPPIALLTNITCSSSLRPILLFLLSLFLHKMANIYFLFRSTPPPPLPFLLPLPSLAQGPCTFSHLCLWVECSPKPPLNSCHHPPMILPPPCPQLLGWVKLGSPILHDAMASSYDLAFERDRSNPPIIPTITLIIIILHSLPFLHTTHHSKNESGQQALGRKMVVILT